MKKQVSKSAIVVPVEIIHNKIFLIRGQKVMLDRDLAELYGVATKVLNLSVKRNLLRFPEDFMFRLTKEELISLRFQFETSKQVRGGRRYLPYVFTQEGVAMLSSVLNSKRAIYVNVQIMRTFARLREFMMSHKELARKIEDLERKFEGKHQEQDKMILMIFEAIKKLMKDEEEDKKRRGPMGFQPPKSAL